MTDKQEPEKPPDLQACKAKFAAARAAIQLYWPFLAPAALRLVPRWTETLQTLAVDKFWRLYMNPRFVEKQSILRLSLLVAGHELQHVIMSHASRLNQYRDTFLEINGEPVSLANVAHDLAINSGLEEFGRSGKAYREAVLKADESGNGLDKPKDAMYPDQFVDKLGHEFPWGQVSEVYAEFLINNAQEGGSSGKGHGPACGNCGSGAGGHGEWEDPTPADLNDAESGVSPEEQGVIRHATAQSVKEQAKKYPGTVPAGVEFWAEVELSPPKVDWRKELAKAIRSDINWAKGRITRTYSRPNRRSVSSMSRVVFPGTKSPEPKFGIVIDTSGSMEQADFAAMFSEIKGILQTCGYRKVPLINCDAAAYEIQWVTDVEMINLTGGGGTRMDLGIRAAVEELDLKLVIVITDGYTPWGEPPGDARVVAVVTNPKSEQPPDWITTIRVVE